MMLLWIILGMVGIFWCSGVLLWYVDEEIFSPYGKIFGIKNFNKTGKIILSVIVTPFTILPTIMVLLIAGLMTAFEYMAYGICWLFAEDREQLHKERFDNNKLKNNYIEFLTR